jgi:hypothetical protein
MAMIICEWDFNDPDPQNPNYSAYEVDYYMWIPGRGINDHRLSLRKNLKSGKYEVYRHFFHLSDEEVLYQYNDLMRAIRAACKERNAYHPRGGSEPLCGDSVCDHLHNRAIRCRVEY